MEVRDLPRPIIIQPLELGILLLEQNQGSVTKEDRWELLGGQPTVSATTAVSPREQWKSAQSGSIKAKLAPTHWTLPHACVVPSTCIGFSCLFKMAPSEERCAEMMRERSKNYCQKPTIWAGWDLTAGWKLRQQLMWDLGQNFFSGKPQCLLWRLSIDWMIPTHIAKGKLLYLQATDCRC